MEKVCYTVITNEYDTLKEPEVISDGWRYVCFTDNIFLKSDVWEIIPYCENNRRVKILGHEYFNGITVYVDGSFIIKADLNLLLQEVPYEFTMLKHERRSCIYEELDYLVRHGKVDECVAADQHERYTRDSFPAGYGLGEHGVLIRNFESKQVRDVCERWWDEFLMGVKRDQVSLLYCFWKAGMTPYYIDEEMRREYFKGNEHL